MKKPGKSVHQKHDRGYKHLLSSKQIFLEMLRSFIKRGWVDQIDEANVIKVDKSYILPDFSGKEADLVYRMKVKDRDVIFYILIELQSTVDSLMPWRLLLYQVEIWRQVMRDTSDKERERAGFKLPVIVPIVLYNGSDNWTAAPSFRQMLAGEELFEDDMLVNFSYILLDVQRYTPEDLEKLSNVIGAVFLIDRNTNLKVEELIGLFKKLAPTIDRLPEEQRQQFAIWFEQILRRFAKTNANEEEIKQVVSNIHKKGMSAVLTNLEKNLDWIEEQAVLRGMEKGMEKGMELGKAKGKAEGVAEGIAEGIESIARNMLSKGMEIALIQEVTGLSKQRIIALKQHFK